MKSEESEESKCLSVSNISEPLSQLTDSPDEDGPEKQAESKDKNINSESGGEMSSSEQESPRFLHKEIRQKCTEYFRSGLSELDVLNRTSLDLRGVQYIDIFKNLDCKAHHKGNLRAEE